jgi:hypothetical protein
LKKQAKSAATTWHIDILGVYIRADDSESVPVEDQVQPVVSEPSEFKAKPKAARRKQKPRVGRSVRIAEGVDLHQSGNGRYRGEFKLITRKQLDGRTRVAHLYDVEREKIIKDLGGEEKLNGVQRVLVDAFVSASLAINDMSTRSMLGEPIDIERLSNAMSTLLRLSRDLRASEEIKNNEPGFSQYMRERYGVKEDAA